MTPPFSRGSPPKTLMKQETAGKNVSSAGARYRLAKPFWIPSNWLPSCGAFENWSGASGPRLRRFRAFGKGCFSLVGPTARSNRQHSCSAASRLLSSYMRKAEKAYKTLLPCATCDWAGREGRRKGPKKGGWTAPHNCLSRALSGAYQPHFVHEWVPEGTENTLWSQKRALWTRRKGAQSVAIEARGSKSHKSQRKSKSRPSRTFPVWN